MRNRVSGRALDSSTLAMPATVKDFELHNIGANSDSTSRAALCQVYDSIFMDVPMSRVKFNVNTEYAYIQNFKILQSKHCPHSRHTTCLGNFGH